MTIVPDPADAQAFPDERTGDAAGRPPGDAADDGKSGGKTGGQSQGGRPGRGNVEPAHGTNAQSGVAKGTEDDRTAPGIDTGKKADSVS